MIGNPVVLHNRTSKPLEFTADGRHYVLQPGDNHGFLEGHVRFACNQNPLMGSEDYYTLEFTSKVGVKGTPELEKQWPCTPIDDETVELAAMEVERLNRATIVGRNRVEYEKVRQPARPAETRSHFGGAAALGDSAR